MSKDRTVMILARRVAGYKHGSVVNVSCDEHGTPTDPFWRRRLKDAKTDKCCELISELPKLEKTTSPVDPDEEGVTDNER